MNLQKKKKSKTQTNKEVKSRATHQFASMSWILIVFIFAIFRWTFYAIILKLSNNFKRRNQVINETALDLHLHFDCTVQKRIAIYCCQWSVSPECHSLSLYHIFFIRWMLISIEAVKYSASENSESWKKRKKKYIEAQS